MPGDSTSTRPLRWPWVVAGGIAIVITGETLVLVARADSLAASLDDIGFGFLASLFAILGALIATHQPGNRVGVALMLIPVGALIGVPADLTVASLDPAPTTVTPSILFILWIEVWSWMLLLFPILLLFYIFPTGHLLSRRWLWAPWLITILFSTAVLSSPFLLEVGPTDGSWELANPYGFLGPAYLTIVGPLFSGAMLSIVVGAVVAMIVRFRRSSYADKARIKLVVVAAVFFAIPTALTATNEVWDDSSLLSLLFAVGMGMIPVAITLAILRYDLFDIDVVISRSLTYGTLAVFIGIVYVGIVVGIGEAFGRGDSVSFGLSIVATTLVAFAFQPARRKVEHWANRVVYGERATPYEVLARFSHRAAEMSDEELLDRIPRLIVEGTGASEAAVWVRSGRHFRTASSWPNAALLRTVDARDSFTDPDADYSLPVFHGDEILGGISLVRARTEALEPAEQHLLENLADGMGLALRNTQLTRQLRQQVRDLKRSRDRVVMAADDARRTLEHDLDSGPQQQLVAVKVKLGPLQLMAQRVGADKTASVLADIESQAGDAIQAVRDFAGGIYPPLLEAEGLEVALHHQSRSTAIPIFIQTDDIGRYPRDIESAVYFTVLESLQNTAKYANASTARVSLAERNGSLEFTVTDDGKGFDLTSAQRGAGLDGMHDRIDTVGGVLRVESVPGVGTTIDGSVPVKEPVPV